MTASAAAGLHAGPARAAGPAPVGTGARVISETYLGERTLDLVIESPALTGTAAVRLLLPPGWTPGTQQTWPVLYLLHGAGDDYTSWTRSTDVAALVKHSDLLVVMPTAGRNGFYSDWLKPGLNDASRWETFHLGEMVPILETGYGAGKDRAIAGLSMGGFGAMSYAARHPGMFRAAAAYSGLVHTTYQSPRGPSLIHGVLVKEGYDPYALWGDPFVHQHIWAAHNPFDQAAALTGMPLYVACGNGKPGPLDPPGTLPDLLIEPLCGEESAAFVDKLRQLGADVTADLYGPGTHSWPWWQRGLHRSLPMLTNAVGL
ncbi:alpha/beta hydrolase family protein [Amycolatopsis sp. YIM 10]|uniref:alpha/beta hydrolase n=1 Tax=Amycolatopsis sp. YIM 10 TaxID=2653857 RepID=UPI001D135B59|nr:alpha/beta hydrolase family protein [Amycolatopsis sp. YIM 10]